MWANICISLLRNTLSRRRCSIWALNIGATSNTVIQSMSKTATPRHIIEYSARYWSPRSPKCSVTCNAPYLQIEVYVCSCSNPNTDVTGHNSLMTINDWHLGLRLFIITIICITISMNFKYWIIKINTINLNFDKFLLY